MSLTKDGFFKQVDHKTGDDKYALLGAGGHKEWSTSNTANTLVARDANKYIYAQLFHSAESEMTSSTAFDRIYVSNDSYIRWKSKSDFGAELRDSGTLDGRWVLKSGDTMNGVLSIDLSGASNNPFYVLSLKGKTDGVGISFIYSGDSSKQGLVLYKPTDWGMAMLNYSSSKAIGILTDGTPYYGWGNNKYTLLHSGNSSVSSTANSITVKINDTTATLTNTDTLVNQSQTTTSSWRPVILGYQSASKSSTSLYKNVTNVVYTTNVLQYQPSTGLLSSTRLDLTQATGTAPMTIASTTKVDNLNADLLDGYHASSFATSGHTHYWADVQVSSSADTETNPQVNNIKARVFTILHPTDTSSERGTLTYKSGTYGWGDYLTTSSNGPMFCVTASNGVYMETSASTGLYVYGGSYYLQIRPESSTWASFYTNSTKYYFNKRIDVAGAIWQYNTNYGLASDGYFYAKGVYANRAGGSTYGGISLYSDSDPMTYGITFRTTGTGTGEGGKLGRVQSDWATYFTMSDTAQRGWIFRSGSTNYASISARGEGYFSAIGNNQYISYPNGGTCTGNNDGTKGAIKIALPTTAYKSSTMLKFTVEIYNYSTGTSSTYIISGYNYENGNWYNVSAYSLRQSTSGYGNLRVRFGIDSDSTRNVVWIGEPVSDPSNGLTQTTWSYPQVYVKNVTLGHSNQDYNKWASGWSVSFVTTLGGTVQTYIDNPATNYIASYANLLYPTFPDTTTTSRSTWNIPSGCRQVWGQKFSDNTLKYTPSGGSATTITDTGDWTIWLAPNATSNVATLNMRIDGIYYGSFSGDLSGNATTATSATNITVTNNTSSNTNYPIVWSNQNNTNNANANQLYKSYDQLLYNPSTKILSVNKINLNREGSTAYGRIYYYKANFYTWVDYMSNSVAGAAPTGGQPSTTTEVTSWAKRSLIENQSGYGWVWEACANSAASATSTKPTARMSLSSNTGQLRIEANAATSTNNKGSLIVSSVLNGSSGNVSIELWRGTNASWSISNESGDLHIRDNYTTSAQTTFLHDNIKVAFNTGTITAKIIQPFTTNEYTLGTGSYRWKALYIGTSDSYGSGTKPIYWNAGVPTPLSDSAGGTATPVYLNAGTITKLTATRGGNKQPVWLNGGEIVASGGSEGSDTQFVYLSSGVITKTTKSLGSTTKPVYLDNGVFKECSTMATSGHTHTLKLGGSDITVTTPSAVTSIIGPFAIDTSADSTKAFSIRRTGDSEAVKHWVDDSEYHIDYTNDEKSSSIHWRIINTDTESPSNPKQTTDFHVYLDSSGNFRPGTNETGSIGTSSYKWKYIYGKTIYGDLTGNVTGNASTATNADKLDGYHATDLYIRNTHMYGLENLCIDVSNGGQTTKVDYKTITTSGTKSDTYFYVKTSENLVDGQIYSFGWYVTGYTGSATWTFYASNNSTCIPIHINKNGWVFGTGKMIVSGAAASNNILIDDAGSSNALVLTFTNFVIVKGDIFPYYTVPISKMSVAYATNAGNADTLDGYHENSFFRYRGELYQNNGHDANTLNIGSWIFRGSGYGNVGNGAAHANVLGENSTIEVFRNLQLSTVAWSNSVSYRVKWGEEVNASTRPNRWSAWYTFLSSENYTSYVYSKSTSDDRYVLKTGDTMTGILTLWGSQYNAYDTGNGALNLNNSDITGVNSILTADLSESWKESIGFKRSNGNYDTFRAADGTFYFGVNNGTEYTALHSGNSSVSLSGSTLTVKINGVEKSLTNTWRGIQDNLTSNSNTTESLSAKQGYLLANGSARDSTKLPLAGGTMVGTISAANDSYGGGGFNNGYANIILRGNTTTGTSGIVFSSSKGDTSINRPSDCAFIQYHPYGVSAATAVGTNPTIGTSGETGRFVIGIHNDSGDQLWLQTSAANDLKHVVGANVYTIYDSGNLPAYPTVNNAALTLQTNGTTQTTFYANDNTAKTFNVTCANIGAATSGHNHDGRYVRSYGTTNDNIDSDWGQSFKTFDPIPSGTPPEQNPNITLLSLGDSWNRRKMLAFTYNNDNIYYRRHTDQGFSSWVKLIHSGNIGSQSVNYATSAGNADTVDGYHNTSFEGYYKTRIDASALDANTWYPVVMSIDTALQTRIRIEGWTDAPGAWNTRSDKHMALMLDYTVQGSSWGWISPFRTIYLSQHGAGATGGPNIGNIGQLTNSSTEYVYVRGGAIYDFYLSRPITPVIKTATYTISSQSVAPTTSAPTAPSRNNALISDITWANLSDKPSSFTPSSHDHDGRYLKLSGGTMSGLITTTSGSSHNGIKVGDTYINAIGGELIFQNNTAIRFGGDSWDWNVWAELGYAHSSKIVYLGLSGSPYSTNSTQTGGKIYTPGISNIYIGNGTYKVWHEGNDGSGSGLDADKLDGYHANGLLTVASLGSSGNSITLSVTVGGKNINTGSVVPPYASKTQQIQTQQNTNSSNHYLTFVDSNNTTANYEYVYTNSTLFFNPGTGAFGQGYNVVPSGELSHAEGYVTTASGLHSHAEGNNTTASGQYAHAEGLESKAFGARSHAEGHNTKADGPCAHAEGMDSVATGDFTHAEGYKTQSYGRYSHVEGCFCYIAKLNSNDSDGNGGGEGSHCEGYGSYIMGAVGAHAEGITTYAYGYHSHTEGKETKTYGTDSHAEGYQSQTGESSGTDAQAAHAEGYQTKARGIASHTSGYGTIANNTAEAAFGKYNESRSDTLFTVGDGTSTTRRNVFEITTSGTLKRYNFTILDTGNYQNYISGGSITHKRKNNANKKYVLGYAATESTSASQPNDNSTMSEVWTDSTFYFTNVGAYHSSDARKKYDIRDILNDDVNKLFETENGFIRHFKWIDSNNDAYGFIAQELKEYCPEAVDFNEDDGFYAVNYNVAFSKIIGAMFKKIKELERKLQEKENH